MTTMKKTTLNEYAGFCSARAGRLLFYPNPAVGSQILSLHEPHCAAVSVAGCVEELLGGRECRLPVPAELFGRLREKIEQAGRKALVRGLDAYLSLWNAQGVRQAARELSRLLDQSGGDFCILLSSSWQEEMTAGLLKNPKYAGARKLLLFDGDCETWTIPPVTLLPAAWCRDGLAGFTGLLRVLSDLQPHTEGKTVLLRDYRAPLAGLNDAVRQLTDLRSLMRTQCGVDDAGLSEAALQYILDKTQEYALPALAAVARAFGFEGADPLKDAPARLGRVADPAQWQAFAWMLRRRLPRGSYLSAVLRRPDVGPDNFLRQYIADAALDAVGCAAAGSYLCERRDAVSAMSSAVWPLIAYFLNQGRERRLADADFLPWMNIGTPLEHAEILRRLPAADWTAGVPAYIAEAFPLIAEYLSPADSLSDEEYTRYFRTYRRLKAQNRITREFADLAYAYSPKDGVPPRTSPQEQLLRPFDDAQTGLLVVDGLGVEYLPLLLGLAGQAGLTAEYTALGYVSLPTESNNNPPDYWHTGGFLPKAMVVDNVAHDGAQRYERTDFAEDFAACLDAFPERILPAIQQGLQRYRRVAVTADHGSSRLAVLAYQNGLCETLPKCGKVVDWRYAEADPHQAAPAKMAGAVNGKFWAVRGYHRLGYPGGKKNEMHGGATLEELLVPVVVLRAADPKAPAGRAAEPRREQMIDVMDSDI